MLLHYNFPAIYDIQAFSGMGYALSVEGVRHLLVVGQSRGEAFADTGRYLIVEQKEARSLLLIAQCQPSLVGPDGEGSTIRGSPVPAELVSILTAS